MGEGLRPDGVRRVHLAPGLPSSRLRGAIRNAVLLLRDALLARACATCGVLLDARLPLALPLCAACSQAVLRPEAPLCPTCGAPGPDAGTCVACRNTPPAFARARAVFVYDGIVPGLVLRLKYGRAWDLARPLGRLVAATAAGSLDLPDLVVPVPSPPARLAARGYNPAALLARSAARALGVPCRADALRRVRDPGPQGHLGAAERRERLQGCFAARDGKGLPGRRILLVDDVLTTGATASDCARALLAAGAARVDVAAVARAVVVHARVDR